MNTISKLVIRLKTLSYWRLLCISTVLVELFTVVMAEIIGLDHNLLFVGVIDAFVVGITITSLLIFLIRRIRKDEELDERVTKDREIEWGQVFDSIPDMIMILDSKHKVVRANKAMADRLGLSTSDVAGIVCYEHVHGLTAPPSCCPHSMCMLDGREHSVEVYEEQLGGHFLVTVAPLFDDRGKICGSVHTARDITERKKAEAEVRDTNAALQRQLKFTDSILRAVPVAVFFKDTEGRYIGCNEEFTKIMGISSNDISGKTVFDLWPGEESEIYHNKDLELLQNPEHQTYEFKVTDCTGRDLDVVFNKDVFIDEKGVIGGIIGTFFDISGRKRAEEKLMETNTMLQTLIRAIPDIVFFKDTCNRYLLTNKAMEDFTGLRQDQLAGMTDEDLLPSDLAADCRISDEAVAESLNAVRCEEHISYGGTKVYLETIKAPVFDDFGNRTGLVGISRDITGRKQMEDDLRRSSEEKDSLLHERDCLIDVLQKALADIKKLQGILPICSSCKMIRDDKGYWTQVESYISEHSEAAFTHSICPDCAKKLYPEYFH